MKASSTVAAPVLRLEFGRGAGRQDLARHSSPRASRTARPPPCRRSRRRRSCPSGATGCGRSAPRTGAATADRRRSSARRGSADPDRGSASSTARASAACRPTASSPAGRRRARVRCCRAVRRCAVALGTGLAEQAAEELDVLADAEIGIEVLAEALRHVGDARADGGAVRRHRRCRRRARDAPGLDLPGAGDEAEQRRLADAVGTDQPDHAAGRDARSSRRRARRPCRIPA